METLELEQLVRLMVAEALSAHLEKHHKNGGRWKPPTLDEVRAYIKANPELGNVDPDLFWKSFNDGGWVDTRGNPVRNWKMKVRTWSSHAEPIIKKQFVRREVVHKCYQCGKQKAESQMKHHSAFCSEWVCREGCT